MMEDLIGILALLPVVGPWIRDRWFLMTGTQMKVECRPETSYFLRDPEHGTGLVVLHLVIENRLGRQLWIKRLQLDVLVGQAWISCGRWPGETYGASWATGWKICEAEDRIDGRIDKHMSLEGRSSTGGYTIDRIGTVIDDSACLTCRVTLAPSQGKSVTTMIEVLRHVNERQRTDVKILRNIDIGLNRRSFHYHASGDEIVTMPRYVYETIQTSNKKDDVQLVRHWELTER